MDRSWHTHAAHCVFLFTIVVTIGMSLSASTASPTLCRSGNFTDYGECCKSCPPGEGATSLCGAANTDCSLCDQNRTFSPDWSTDKCRTCTECTPDEITVERCNLTHDTNCRCKIGLFRRSPGVCSQCNVCPPGYGTIQPCTFLEDIQCERCVELKTYSDSVTRATMCKPCTKCGKGAIVVKNCTLYSDTVCAAPQSDGDSSSSNGTGVPYYPGGISIVPLYCVLLAALVIGLLIYVVFKRWTIYQLKLNNSQKMVRSTTSSTDIEKNPEQINGSQPISSTTYKGPSSYTVATVPSLNEVSDSTVYKELSSDRKEKLVENLKQMKTQNGHQWSALCKELRFSESDVANFNKSAADDGPARNMLHSWQSRDGNMATVKFLAQALRNIRREDLADTIRGKGDGL